MVLFPKEIRNCIVLIFAILIVLAFVKAWPVGPQYINVTNTSSWGGNISPKIVQAEAGNVTELFINGTRSTWFWQGYYGNISGTVVLADSEDYVMYDWVLVNPTGEVYAANGTINNWSNVRCVNFSSNANETGMNLTTLERMYNMSSYASDGVDETFNLNYTGSFYIGDILINESDKCPLTYTYVNGSYQTNYYGEVLLTDGINIIFTTFIADDTDGFKGGIDLHDFQMIVGENGKDSATTPYYFYVEIG